MPRHASHPTLPRQQSTASRPVLLAIQATNTAAPTASMLASAPTAPAAAPPSAPPASSCHARDACPVGHQSAAATATTATITATTGRSDSSYRHRHDAPRYVHAVGLLLALCRQGTRMPLGNAVHVGLVDPTSFWLALQLTGSNCPDAVGVVEASNTYRAWHQVCVCMCVCVRACVHWGFRRCALQHLAV